MPSDEKLHPEFSTQELSARPSEGFNPVRDINKIKESLEMQGIPSTDTETGGLTASLEDRVTETWDNNGRLVKTVFEGDRGAAGSKNLTETFAYYEDGKLKEMKQVINKNDGTAQELQKFEF